MTWLCVQASAFLSFVIVILCLASVCITMVRCVAYIHELCMTLAFDLNIKIIFSPWIWDWQDVFTLWHRHTKFWHMGVSPWDNFDLSMTLTFDLYVVDGGILSEFYSQFLSCFTLAIVLACPVIPSNTKIFFIFFSELLMTATWCFLQPQLVVLHCPYRFHTCLASASFLPLYSKDFQIGNGFELWSKLEYIWVNITLQFSCLCWNQGGLSPIHPHCFLFGKVAKTITWLVDHGPWVQGRDIN